MSSCIGERESREMRRYSHEMQRVRQSAGTANAYVYHARIIAGRPAGDHTARIVPRHSAEGSLLYPLAALERSCNEASPCGADAAPTLSLVVEALRPSC